MKKDVRKVAAIAGIIAFVMFSFSFAMAPLYNVLCQITGINGGANVTALPIPAEKNISTKNYPELILQFVTTNNANLPWDFYPEKNQIHIQPGQREKMIFIAKNKSNHTMTVQAIPSFTPPLAAKYFHKLECFCFHQQTLTAGEVIKMPVIFEINTAIPAEMHTITLSYTLFAVKKSVKIIKQEKIK